MTKASPAETLRRSPSSSRRLPRVDMQRRTVIVLASRPQRSRVPEAPEAIRIGDGQLDSDHFRRPVPAPILFPAEPLRSVVLLSRTCSRTRRHPFSLPLRLPNRAGMPEVPVSKSCWANAQMEGTGTAAGFEMFTKISTSGGRLLFSTQKD